MYINYKTEGSQGQETSLAFLNKKGGCHYGTGAAV